LRDIFHTRCHINNKICCVIIDNESCVNIASTILVKNLNMNIIKHEKPCKPQWFDDCREVKVINQVLVSFLVGKYKDEILCDVMPMHATHLLLGRLW